MYSLVILCSSLPPACTAILPPLPVQSILRPMQKYFMHLDNFYSRIDLSPRYHRKVSLSEIRPVCDKLKRLGSLHLPQRPQVFFCVYMITNLRTATRHTTRAVQVAGDRDPTSQSQNVHQIRARRAWPDEKLDPKRGVSSIYFGDRPPCITQQFREYAGTNDAL